ncbi:MAG: PIN domain protein [Methanobacterium sp. PtaU1.Bin242]|nr:MAG: PIN domain protein [Methanobacterium sp. PtaU1.Bin242]
MRILDANVIIYSFTEPSRNINPKTLENMKNAINIMERLRKGNETVYITSIQISETLNLIESSTNTETSIRVQKFLLDNPFIKIIEITHIDMINAHQIVKQYRSNKIGFNDAIAYIGMLKTMCTEIYTFDKHFDIFPEIKRIEK